MKEKRKYVRVCPVCKGTKQYDLIQTFQGQEITTPVSCTHCDSNGNAYDNRPSIKDGREGKDV